MWKFNALLNKMHYISNNTNPPSCKNDLLIANQSFKNDLLIANQSIPQKSMTHSWRHVQKRHVQMAPCLVWAKFLLVPRLATAWRH